MHCWDDKNSEVKKSYLTLSYLSFRRKRNSVGEITSRDRNRKELIPEPKIKGRIKAKPPVWPSWTISGWNESIQLPICGLTVEMGLKKSKRIGWGWRMGRPAVELFDQAELCSTRWKNQTVLLCCGGTFMDFNSAQMHLFSRAKSVVRQNMSPNVFNLYLSNIQNHSLHWSEELEIRISQWHVWRFGYTIKTWISLLEII